ncbi:MAG: hypothetical protein K1X53_02670 [Candidatus Sumerlaeaceae bacterium]|nr:hypothetical protein [Candidatus Sumerlaeaceae bacterium]
MIAIRTVRLLALLASIMFPAAICGAVEAAATPSPVSAEMTATAESTTKTESAPAPQATPSAEMAKHGPVVLFGEVPRWSKDGKRPEVRDVTGAARVQWKGEVIDKMTTGELAANTLKRVDAIKALHPQIVILFNGASDQDANTGEDAHVKALKETAEALVGSGIHVYVVSSDPSIRAAFSAHLRIASSLANATFSETGTEFGGKPYEEAFAEIAKTESLRAVKPAIPPTTAAAASVPPSAGDDATSGLRVYSGGPAQTPVAIQMVPPPALKQFDPRDSLGKKPTTKAKKPAVSR